ncbi:dTDP-4-dehydrorhamnose 3,5-epimerase [Erwinia sp. OLTSP20]|uniref:dTDP-4-dehydrorhamnose 3,5-epimerase n=1 Tax=unclassified Erwinia TaxID=2622719 RepID=UPI000C19F3CB|nr:MULTISPECIES: dTDP-4-dehydrorhamnose 3,5-epimerase [unclassified Erwinia]PIJ48181.1 dTDP-4-dehydrorhamnose 3,5-epimerase [Erwinia sp. OAMSP11]PIJ69143.1 dTDP-4-dehydrorhamnose 3,5-epimerase [Erwinia sp. OLSSP12]PIJ78378.1 dTDP-4-dehydrorhamnose 3,5-epimerase [Erwinia sp. OLCASP19]PIJ81087.1 dTDP-4-dehydrorhamnose 3,5-epimerase [Erwinia sp. OLMDSP33]PIJ81822.1 dTDP-4-dehydrorhamnose 3,5-epimerase [Erwinia sp. OLMTSP26]
MKIIDTEIPDVKIIEPAIFGDDRGYFYESFNQHVFNQAVGRHVEFVQDNHSMSKKGVLRGLHYQLPPHAQGKLVRCVEGEVFDVAVDIRKSSCTFGQWVGVHLSAENHQQLWIPEGFAHGFLTISERVQFVYKTTNYYAPQAERSISWNDTEINITWPEMDSYTLSGKDEVGLSFSNAELFE